MKRKVKILVIDDDPHLRKTLVDILRIKGYETAAAGTGAEAIKVVEHDTVSVALIDLMLPDQGGLDVMARIKALSPLTEAIILTGHASMDTAIEATGQGAFSYVLKPYQMDDLLRMIGHAVERTQAQQEILRLASYPRLDPNPIIEVSLSGDVTYINPVADTTFPGLMDMGLSHPILAGTKKLFETFQPGGPLEKETIREIRFDNAVYEQHISYVPEGDVIRIHVLEITERKQAEEALAKSESEQAAIATLGSQALAGLELPWLFEQTVSLIANTLNVDHCMILENPAEKHSLVFRAGIGFGAALADKMLLEAETSACLEKVMMSKTPIYFGDTNKASHLAVPALLKQQGAVNGLCLAIASGKHCYGVLCVCSTSAREFGIDDAMFLQAVNNILATAIQRKRSEADVLLMATTDSLTEIANRREFNRILEREIERAKRFGGRMSLIMFDIDHFKRVNDLFGHDVGDEILQTIATIVKENIRAVDVFARWGGEEFMILVLQSDMPGARALAEKLRLKIAGHQFKKIKELTVSFGVGAFDPNDDVLSLVKRADDALYRAKNNGRNRVETLVAAADSGATDPRVGG